MVYLGTVPEVVVAMLACAPVGAVPSAVFGGFAAEALGTAGQSGDAQRRVIR